ncbi:hypothetical protein GLAREA_03144 [Glarea lozoyensis ATCC 20868]|uniref:Uncharacterized protein n=1 Tax=Glarea lozoyensis (strain ATCC 20868 / MF5171) TaxID=1116229 RepID=S3CQ18_GLAL2|nr:uncharacterized protein GLAREA_03144 [Glarea lozoyensis ATCC 20868]EPE27229.1 hypothetical protein GLAREA_03144 [Glarea lozoyensis ATCC 20868]
MPQASENRHPRIAIRSTLAKKPSRVALREPKASPVKGAVNAKPTGNVGRDSPAGSIRTKQPEKPNLGSPTKRPTKGSVETPPPTKTSLRSTKAFVVKTYEVIEDDLAPRNPTKGSDNGQHSDHSSHSHPVLAIGGLSESTKNMFMAHQGKKQATPPIPLKDPRRRLLGTNNTDADDEGSETFEDSIRSALATPGTHNYHQRAQTPTSVKSVRWDPAVVSVGRITSGAKPALDDSPWVFPPSTTKEQTSITDVLKTLSRLKKEDQQTLRDYLRDLGSPESEDRSSITQRPSREETNERFGLDGMFAKKLNPEASVFRKVLGPKKQTEKQENPNTNPQLESLGETKQAREPNEPVVVTSTPRKGLKMDIPHRQKVERSSKEPTWINIYNPPSAKDMPAGFSNFASNPLNRNGPELSQPLPAPASNLMPLTSGWHGGLYDPQQTVWVPMPIFPTPHGFQALPMIPPHLWNNTFSHRNQLPFNDQNGAAHKRPPYNPRRPPHKSKSANGPLVDVSLANVPPEWGPGRVAQPVDEAWGQSLINQFSSKYPRTGKVDIKAKYQAPGQMRQAAAIQQELELLIYTEKEKAAAMGKAGLARPKPPVSRKEPKITVVEKGSFSSENEPLSSQAQPEVLGYEQPKKEPELTVVEKRPSPAMSNPFSTPEKKHVSRREPSVTIVEKRSSSDDDPFTCSTKSNLLASFASSTNTVQKSWEQW